MPLDEGRFGFWTSSRSGKYKRLRNNPTITVQPSDARGRVKDGSSPVAGTATLVTSGTDFDAIQGRVRAKYGVQVPISKFLNTLGHLGKGKFRTATSASSSRQPGSRRAESRERAGASGGSGVLGSDVVRRADQLGLR